MKYLQTAKLTIDDSLQLFGRGSVELFARSVTNPNGLDLNFNLTRKRFDPFADISVTLYNVSQSTFKLLNRKDSPFRNSSKIRCDAGYKGSNKLIFSGTIYRARNQFFPGEKTTNLTVSSYSNNLVDTVVSKSYKKSPRFSQVLQDLATQASVTVNLNRLSSSDDKAMSQKSYSFSGTIPRFLQEAASHNPNITAQFYNDVVLISSINIPQTPSIKTITSKNGMILSPVLTEDNLVKVDTVFDPDYQISSFITVESSKFIQPKVTGEIYKLTHNFSTVSGSTSSIEILPLGQAVPRNNLGVGP